MTLQETSQPAPAGDALGRFARASVLLAGQWDAATLGEHAERLAVLTGSDLVLLYEATVGSHELALVAQWGLAPGSETRFKTLGTERSIGAGGLRSLGSDPSPLPYAPLTNDLLTEGIRAFWGYPLWTEGELIGQLFFGSRRWDRYHEDTLSVFAASTIQVSQALEKRRTVACGPDESAWTDSGGQTAAAKRQQFIAVLAHELRNPIAPIRSGLDLISRGLLDDKAVHSNVDMMQRQVAHLVRLIDDLLDTVRLDTGKLTVKRAPTILKDVIRSAIECIRPALQSKAQALRLIDDAANVVVDVDPVRLTQAFVNILSANVRQTPERGVIAVSVALQSSTLDITFEDEGPGVDAGGPQNVFALFPRSPMQASDDGLGIGLALVKGLIELNHGTVDVRNRDGTHGCAYTVVLPVSSFDTAALDVDADKTGHAWPSHRVLVVDDNRDAANTLGLLFELDGHTVRLAHDGPSAVSQAMEFQPEVILMDIGLPGFNGHEAVRRIRAHAGAVRPYVIALTGWGAQSDRDATRDAGCDLHLVKPIAHDVLSRTLFESMADAAGRRGQD